MRNVRRGNRAQSLYSCRSANVHLCPWLELLQRLYTLMIALLADFVRWYDYHSETWLSNWNNVNWNQIYPHLCRWIESSSRHLYKDRTYLPPPYFNDRILNILSLSINNQEMLGIRDLGPRVIGFPVVPNFPLFPIKHQDQMLHRITWKAPKHRFVLPATSSLMCDDDKMHSSKANNVW